MVWVVNCEKDNLAALIESLQGRELEARYLAYFECFSRQQYFEAHEVLEPLWLSERGGPKDRFYKGLIQLAGAFVHVQRNRPAPAVALLKLARANLEKYPARQDGLAVDEVGRRIDGWLVELEAAGLGSNPLAGRPAPQLGLQQAA
jgi:predicted metal-dependent hydrolase